MFEMIKFQMFVEFVQMDEKHRHRGYDWTQEFVRPVGSRLPLMDRFLPALGEKLILAGNKLKQRSHAHLSAEQAQAPNYMIML